MFKYTFIFFLINSFFVRSFSQEIKVLSWNIRFDNKNDGLDQWSYRKKDMVDQVKKVNPDFFGIQEGLYHQVTYLDKKLTNHKFIGVGRDDGIRGGEMMALFYNHRRWFPISTGNFWLSDTLDQVSRGWDAACNRITTYGIFHNKKGDTIAVYNTHLDHMGVEARTNSVRQLKALIDANPYPKILMGDFNFNPSNSLYNDLTQVWSDAKMATPNIVENQDGTFNGFKLESTPKDRIDYILTDQNWVVSQYYSANLYTKKGRHISDHNLVLTSLNLLKKPSYLYRRHIVAGDTLPYRLLYPKNFNLATKYPIVLFLHGAGERGNDNEAQLIHGSKLFLDSIEKYPAIVIFPQCKSGKYWASVDIQRAPDNNFFNFKNAEFPTTELQNVIKLLEKIKMSPSIDASRIYLGGLSMGGMGTWELLWRLPDTFAAAIPICGGGYKANVDKMISTPIWAFHGDNDKVVNIKYSIEMIDALKARRGHVRFTIYEGVGHDSWTPAFAEHELLGWMFGKRR